MDAMHEVPLGGSSDPRLDKALSRLRRLGDQCVLLELTVRSGRQQEDRLRWESDRFDCKAVRRAASAVADFCDETLGAYLTAVADYAAATTGVWKQLDRGDVPDVDQTPPATQALELEVEDLRCILESTPSLPEPRSASRAAAQNAVEALAGRLQANELPAASALDDLENPDDLELGVVAQRLSTRA
jgi:hypothetical protein